MAMLSQGNQHTRLPNIVYFHGGYQEKPFECTNAIAAVMGCTYTLPGTWSDLTRELEAGAEYVAFHVDHVLTKGNRSIKEFAEAIFTVAERMPNFTKLHIGVVIKRDTDASVIQELQRNNISGILLDIHDYPMEEICAATTALISDKPYWPEHIISQLPESHRKKTVISYRLDQQPNWVPSVQQQIKIDPRFEIEFCNRKDGLVKLLSSPVDLVLLNHCIFNKNELTVSEIINMIKSMCHYNTGGAKTKIGIVIDDTTDRSFIARLKLNSDINGIVPSSECWGTEISCNAVADLLDGKNNWHDDIVGQLPVRTIDKDRLHIYFQAGRNDVATPEVVAAYNALLPVHVEICSTWDEFDRLLDKNPYQIVFHPSQLLLADKSLTDLVLDITTRLQLANLDIPIAVALEKTTTIEHVKQLKKAGIFGLVPYHGDWSSEESIKSIELLADRIPYWPEHLISQLPSKPRYIYFRETQETHISPKQKELYKKVLPLEMLHVIGWDKLDEALLLEPEYLSFNINTIINNQLLSLQEIMLMIRTKLKILKLDIPIIVGINKNTNASYIKQLKKEGIHSIIPTFDFGLNEVIKAQQSVIDGVNYWPSHIISQLPTTVKTTKHKVGTLLLTSRQVQILGLIKDRGASNKVIAKALNLSESTIKLHIGAILRKYGLKNRTQLALFSDKNTVT